MSRTLLRMERPTAGLNHPLPAGFALDQYQRRSHHALVPRLYADYFAEEPWGDDCDAFDEFDPNGIFIANHELPQDPAVRTHLQLGFEVYEQKLEEDT